MYVCDVHRVHMKWWQHLTYVSLTILMGFVYRTVFGQSYSTKGIPQGRIQDLLNEMSIDLYHRGWGEGGACTYSASPWIRPCILPYYSSACDYTVFIKSCICTALVWYLLPAVMPPSHNIGTILTHMSYLLFLIHS